MPKSDFPRMRTVLAALSVDACLTTDALVKATGITNRGVVDAMAQLISRGHAVRREVGCYVMTPEGAAFLASGEPYKPGRRGKMTASYVLHHPNNLRARLWSALRIKGKASIPELMELAGKGEANGITSANRYLAALTKVGILRELRRAPGTAVSSPGYKRYQLINDLGPVAPQLRNKASEIYDHNTRTTYPLGGAK